MIANWVTVTDAKSQTTTYTYDEMDRLKTRTDALGRTESYQYDLNGNLASSPTERVRWRPLATTR